MNAEWKEKWIAALESGKYRQGCGQLQADGAYCCLGVLCDVVAPDKWTPGQLPGGMLHIDSKFTPSASLCEETSLDKDAVDTLWRMNDVALAVFPTIIKWIKENL